MEAEKRHQAQFGGFLLLMDLFFFHQEHPEWLRLRFSAKSINFAGQNNGQI